MAKCTICAHPDRYQIELLSISGAGLVSLAERFNLGPGGKDRLWRHMKAHVNAETRALMVADVPLSELAARAAAEGTSLLDHIRIVRSGLMQLFIACRSSGDAKSAAAVAGRLLELFRDLGELTGEMVRASPVTNNYTTFNVFMASPFFIDLQTMLVERLRAHPEALASVVAGLRELEAKDTGKMIEGRADALAA